MAQLGKHDRMQTPPKASEEMTASLRPHALGPSLGTVPLVALSQHRRLVQHRTQQRVEAYIGGRWYTFDPCNNVPRNNVQVRGAGDRAMVFAHGFGCDQNMWRFVAPAFEKDFMTVVFDHVGAGGSDLSAHDRAKYSTLSGYADDVVEIGTELGLKDSVFVGHSVSSMIGVLAARQAPGTFGKLVLIGPSARYIDDEGYVGGFSAKQIDELLEFLESNHMGWSAQMAPMIMGNSDRPDLGQELTNSFCRTDPDIAKAFARVTFTSDNRKDLAEVSVPTSSSNAAKTSSPPRRSAISLPVASPAVE